MKTYNDYQDIHKAYKAKEIKLGEKAIVKYYGNIIIIAPPDYPGEINAIGQPIRYKIKEINA